jgi:molybdate transport system substrate-binding protein
VSCRRCKIAGKRQCKWRGRFAEARCGLTYSFAMTGWPFDIGAFNYGAGHCGVVILGAIQNKLKAGAKPDLVILSTAAVAAAEKDGAVLAGIRAVVGRAEIGVAVRDGTPAPDILTTDAFKRALLAAKSVSFADPAGGGTAAVFVADLLDRLGITDAVKEKAVPFNTGREVIAAVLKGDAELGIGFTTEFVPVKGVKVVGVLPKEIEFVNEYSAYIPTTSGAADLTRSLLAYLARPASRDAFKAAGVMPQQAHCIALDTTSAGAIPRRADTAPRQAGSSLGEHYHLGLDL